jgi:hypothetical protein
VRNEVALKGRCSQQRGRTKLIAARRRSPTYLELSAACLPVCLEKKAVDFRGSIGQPTLRRRLLHHDWRGGFVSHDACLDTYVGYIVCMDVRDSS